MTQPSATDLSGLLVIIPAWNEQEAIGGVLAELRASCAGATVLVVSDGSTDATAAIARQHGAVVLDLPFNLGVGGAMRCGYRYAVSHGFTHAVQVDADGQHDPAEIVTLLRALEDEKADLVIGSRFAGPDPQYDVRGPRKWAMSFLATTLSSIASTRLTDTTSGFKLAGPRAVGLFAEEMPAEYLGDTVEALVLVARAGLVVREVEVHMRERAGGTPSHNPLKSALFLGRAFLAVALAQTRRRAPIAEDLQS